MERIEEDERIREELNSLENKLSCAKGDPVFPASPIFCYTAGLHAPISQ
jgi:hypothetical protein